MDSGKRAHQTDTLNLSRTIKNPASNMEMWPLIHLTCVIASLVHVHVQTQTHNLLHCTSLLHINQLTSSIIYNSVTSGEEFRCICLFTCAENPSGRCVPRCWSWWEEKASFAYLSSPLLHTGASAPGFSAGGLIITIKLFQIDTISGSTYGTNLGLRRKSFSFVSGSGVGVGMGGLSTLVGSRLHLHGVDTFVPLSSGFGFQRLE